MPVLFRTLRLSLVAACTLCALPAVHADPVTVPPPPALSVLKALPPAAAGVTDLKFGDMFKRPVGPAGLEMTDKLRALEGKRVRIVGHMATAEEPTPGMLILSPLPVTLGDEDEKLVDDLPPNAVFVHLSAAHERTALPNFGGLLQLTGTLELGPHEEADGHVSHVRLRLDDVTSRTLARAAARLPRRVASATH